MVSLFCMKDSPGTLYRPIVDPYEIRVLEIKPGSNDDLICCALHHCSLEFKEPPRKLTRNLELLESGPATVPQTKFGLLMNDLTVPIWYTALSYTWGPAVFDMPITVDGYEKLITKSLYGALQHLRQPGHSVVLWIDQICIDQKNNDEKAQQIPLMSIIYTRAVNTIVWLGEGDANLADAFDFLNEVPDLILHASAIRCPEDFTRLCLPVPEATTWAGVWDLITRPWFQRLWIYQEVILSQDITIACGGEHKARTRINWDVFTSACLVLQESGVAQWLNLKFPGPDPFTQILRLFSDRQGYPATKEPWPEQWLISPALRSARQSLCYDPRDKIYGLLGMIEIENNWIKISYHDSYKYSNLYHDVVVGLLKRNTAPLKSMLNSIDHEPLEGCPSWVPDWSKPRETAALGYESSSANVYNASGADKVYKFLKHPTDYQIVGPNSNALHIEGKVFDTIAVMSDVLSGSDIVLPLSANKDWIHCIEFVSSQFETAYPSAHGSVFTAFWHTMVAGKASSGMHPCPDTFAEIFSLLLDETTGRSPSLPGQTYSPRQMRPLGKGKLTIASLESRQPKKTFEEIKMAMRKPLKGRRLVKTERGYLGLVPRYSRVGDKIGIVKGCWMPYALREDISGEGWSVVGETFVEGVMRGEEADGMDKIVLV
ncbi:HET-domain-containing protein [Cercophora samala]|uniref:HET-domain-containing protein n=1 Tax=Cercophora samala TaxID=330535 RepID=A0AA39ZDE0_9PEZI|nr:HET-domain-containing protein [Cercophora samala]